MCKYLPIIIVCACSKGKSRGKCEGATELVKLGSEVFDLVVVPMEFDARSDALQAFWGGGIIGQGVEIR